MEQEKNTLTVLEIAPGHYPKQVEIDPDLKALQQAVGGNIGASYPFSDPVAIVYNDEGKLMGLPLNRALRDGSGEAYDVVAGTFAVHVPAKSGIWMIFSATSKKAKRKAPYFKRSTVLFWWRIAGSNR